MLVGSGFLPRFPLAERVAPNANLFAKAKKSGLSSRIDESVPLCLLKRLQKIGMVGRRPYPQGARAVVRQRLVAANHHARECKAPDQSMSALAQVIAPLEIDREPQRAQPQRGAGGRGTGMYIRRT
jgi:hypothetical protein